MVIVKFKSQVSSVIRFELGDVMARVATTLEQVTEQAMALPRESRAQLADLLGESLDGEELGRIDQLWLVEAKRRRDEVRTGVVDTVPGEEALGKVRELARLWRSSRLKTNLFSFVSVWAKSKRRSAPFAQWSRVRC